MSQALRTAQAKKHAALKAAEAITAKASAENRDLTAEEAADFDKYIADGKAAQAAIDRETERLALVGAPSGAATASSVDIAGNIIASSDMRDADPKRGFKSKAEFFGSVLGAARSASMGHAADQRLAPLAAAPTTFGGEGSGADGGFAIPPEFAREIFTLSQTGGTDLLPLCDEVQIGGNTMSFPKDETTPWGTDGIRAYWQGEATAAAASKPALGLDTLRLKKLIGLVPVSDELLADSSALASYLPKKLGASVQWKRNEAILFGAGGAQPAGSLNSNAVITVAKDSGQAANTLTATNLANMVARLPEGSFGKSVWIINNDALPALFTMTLGNYPIYLPVGVAGAGMQGSPYGMLMGRPVLVSQHANTFSGAGDVNLVDLSYYQAITKAGGDEMATSMHLYFDAAATAFRITSRMDGMSKLSKAIDPAKGTNKLSPFVKLGAR